MRRWPSPQTVLVDGTEARGRIRSTFADPTKRSVLLLAAILVNFVFAFLNLFHVFDHAPTWVGVFVWVINALVLLVLLGVLTYLMRDWRQRRQTK